MQIKYLPHARPGHLAAGACHLQRSTAGAAGYDLRACSLQVPCGNHIARFGVASFGPGEVVAFGTGIALDMGAGYEETSLCGMVVPRSGLGSRGLVLANGTGIIDPDYHGEIIVKLRNVSDEPINVNAFDRIAQILFVPVFFPAWEVVEEFASTTGRGAAGFGSTGVL
jgi:dUTP pyrophosphatase